MTRGVILLYLMGYCDSTLKTVCALANKLLKCLEWAAMQPCM